MTTLDSILGKWYVERVLKAVGDREGVKAQLRKALADPVFRSAAHGRLHALRQVTKNDRTEDKPTAPEMRCFISRIHQELLEEVLNG